MQDLLQKQQLNASTKKEVEAEEKKTKKNESAESGTTVTANVRAQKPEAGAKELTKPQQRTMFEGRTWHSVEVSCC